jgi:hypothetical protein
LYFVTYTLSKKEEFLDGKCRESVSIRSIKPDQVFKLYDRLYRHTCSRPLGRNFHRKRAAQPIVLACLDFPYTRKRSEIRSRTDTTPHIHALYAVKVELADRFDELCDPLVQQPLMQSVDKRFRSCKIIPIQRSDVDTLSSYTTKALRYFPEHVIQQDMWTMFPKSTYIAYVKNTS